MLCFVWQGFRSPRLCLSFLDSCCSCMVSAVYRFTRKEGREEGKKVHAVAVVAIPPPWSLLQLPRCCHRSVSFLWIDPPHALDVSAFAFRSMPTFARDRSSCSPFHVRVVFLPTHSSFQVLPLSTNSHFSKREFSHPSRPRVLFSAYPKWATVCTHASLVSIP